MNQDILIPQLNLNDICTAYTQTANGTIEHQDAYTTFIAPGFFYTRNIIAKQHPENLPEIIESILRGAESGKPTLTTFTEELMPEGAVDLFKQNGFQILLTQTGMIFDPSFPAEPAPDPHITRISAEELPLWMDAMIAGFVEEGKKREDVIYENLIKRPDMYFYAYKEDGVITGTILLHLTGGIAGVHEVAVPPAYRGRGISKRMVRHVMDVVNKNGGSGITLQASVMGKPVYETLGFYTTGTIHSMFRA